MFLFERGLCPRNRFLGEVSEGAVEAPSEETPQMGPCHRSGARRSLSTIGPDHRFNRARIWYYLAMKTVSIDQLKRNLSAFIAEAAGGEHIVLARRATLPGGRAECGRAPRTRSLAVRPPRPHARPVPLARHADHLDATVARPRASPHRALVPRARAAETLCQPRRRADPGRARAGAAAVRSQATPPARSVDGGQAGVVVSTRV